MIIAHLRGFGVAITLVYEQESSSELEYAFALCSKKDQFSRKAGRQLAEDRLEVESLLINTRKTLNHQEAVLRCLVDIMANVEYPCDFEELLTYKIGSFAGRIV